MENVKTQGNNCCNWGAKRYFHNVSDSKKYAFRESIVENRLSIITCLAGVLASCNFASNLKKRGVVSLI